MIYNDAIGTIRLSGGSDKTVSRVEVTKWDVGHGVRLPVLWFVTMIKVQYDCVVAMIRLLEGLKWSLMGCGARHVMTVV